MFSITFFYNILENNINKIFTNDILITKALKGVPKVIDFDFNKHHRRIIYHCHSRKIIGNYIKRAINFKNKNKNIKLNWHVNENVT